MTTSSKFGMSTRRVKGGKKVPQGTKSKKVTVQLPASIAKSFGIGKQNV